MINLSLAEVCKLLDAELLYLDRSRVERFPPVCIDSRSLCKGQCFAAIQGKSLDGHDFILAALEAGASLLIVSRIPADSLQAARTVSVLKVRDTTVALQTLAHYVRRKWGSPLIAVTGSVGKTTTRRFAARVLETRFSVLQSIGNFNNEIGVPLSLLALTEDHNLAILELGMNHAGEIRLLSRICSPDVGVLTNVEPAHLEFFSSVDDIAEAKGELLEYLDPKGVLLFNRDDPRVCRLAARFTGERVSFGLDSSADISIPRYRINDLERMDFELVAAGKHFHCQVGFSGRHLLYNVAAAVAIGFVKGVEPEHSLEAIQTLKPSDSRCQTLVRETRQGGRITVLDDSYNSSPAALRAVLEVVRQLKTFGRKVLALGEMLELGETSDLRHREAGSQAAACGADLLVVVGGKAGLMADGAIGAGFPAESVFRFGDSEQAGHFLAGELRDGDFLLCKGSRGVRMERILSSLAEREKERDR